MDGCLRKIWDFTLIVFFESDIMWAFLVVHLFIYLLFVNRSNTITSRVARATLSTILDSVQYVDENGGPTFPPLDDVFKNSGVRENEEIDAEVSLLLLLMLWT